MRKKKILAMMLVAMLSLSGLTGCSDKDKEDMNNKLNNKTTETTKKDDSKADDKTSESTTEDKSDNKKSDSNSGNTDSNSSANKPSNSNSNKSDSSTSKPSQPAHQHTWVDHKATRTVTEYVHHDAVYQDVTTPAVTQTQEQCLGCKQWFSSLDDIVNHAMKVKMGIESGDPQRCGSVGGVEREVVITPAKTEHKLVKDAWDEPVQKTETYVDYQYCSGCGQHK